MRDKFFDIFQKALRYKKMNGRNASVAEERALRQMCTTDSYNPENIIDVGKNMDAGLTVF